MVAKLPIFLWLLSPGGARRDGFGNICEHPRREAGAKEGRVSGVETTRRFLRRLGLLVVPYRRRGRADGRVAELASVSAEGAAAGGLWTLSRTDVHAEHVCGGWGSPCN